MEAIQSTPVIESMARRPSYQLHSLREQRL